MKRKSKNKRRRVNHINISREEFINDPHNNPENIYSNYKDLNLHLSPRHFAKEHIRQN